VICHGLLISEIHDADGKGYHFHYVNLDHRKRRYLKGLLRNIVVKQCDQKLEVFPDFFQFEVYTHQDSAPRVFGFIGRGGIFYPVWFDKEHKIYS
jgi:hypothetical protein